MTRVTVGTFYNKLVIPGGTGFLGRVLANWFVDLGWEVVIFSRSFHSDETAFVRTVPWDGRTMGDWVRELEGTAAIVNLSGRSVNCRYHTRNRREIMDSRIESTRVLGEAMARCHCPPKVWLNSSTATIYKHSFDRSMDEATGIVAATPEAKDEFSVQVATAWEREFYSAPTPQTRKVALRTAMVLGTERGTVFQVLRRLARLGLGGAMGHGRQYVSWIHEVDFCRAVEWLISHEEISGSVNVTAPNPVTNREVMRRFRQVGGMPFGLPAARWMLEIGAFFLRTETELIIKSRRVVPGILSAAGFDFRFPRLESALDDLMWQRRKKIHASAGV